MPTEEPPEIVAPAPQLAEIDERRARELLVEILSTMDEQKRTVYVLHDIEEVPMSEIAMMLSCRPRTAYSRLDAARKDVTRAWKRALLPRGRR